MASVSNKSPLNIKECASESGDETGSSSSDEDKSGSSDSDIDGNERIHVGKSDGVVVDDRSSRFRALCDFDGDQEGDLKFKKGDTVVIVAAREDGWWEAQNSSGVRGLVPSTFLEPIVRRRATDQAGREGLATDYGWKNVAAAVRKPNSFDVLAALGALPPGCTESLLASLCGETDSRHRLSRALTTRLSPSGLGVAELFWNSSNNQIELRGCRIQRLFTLVECRNVVDLRGGSVEVLARCIRVSLADGRSVIGNVHKVAVGWDHRSPGTWSPGRQTSSIIPTSLGPSFFVRSSVLSTDVGLLIELCVRYRNVKSQEEGELSCGWAHLPLLQETGQPISNRTAKLNVNMGSPFDRSTLDFSPASVALKGIHPLRAMIHNRRKPIVVIKVDTPSKNLKSQLDLLCDHLVACTSWVPYLVFYRQILADAILHRRKSSSSAAPMHSPFLTAFPSTMDQFDLVDIMHMIWTGKLKTEKRNRRDTASLSFAFQKMFLESVYVLWQLDGLPPYKFGDPASSKVREEAFERCLATLKTDKNALPLLLSSDHVHRPFDVAELGLDPLHPECLAVTSFDV